MKKILPLVLVCASFPVMAQAQHSPNSPTSSFALLIDPVQADTERPAGNRSERHSPRLGVELARTVWPRFDVFAGAGAHRLRVDNAGVKTSLAHFDLRVGARQFFGPRQVMAWTPFIDASISQAWLRDDSSTVGNNRRFGGWNAAIGASKRWSASTDIRVALGYTRLLASDKAGDHTDELSTVDLRLAAGFLF